MWHISGAKSKMFNTKYNPLGQKHKKVKDKVSARKSKVVLQRPEILNQIITFINNINPTILS